LLKLSASTLLTVTEFISKFRKSEILVTQKIRLKKIQFCLKWCGILAFRLHWFSEIGGSIEWLQKVGDFLKTFPPEGANFFHMGSA